MSRAIQQEFVWPDPGSTESSELHSPPDPESSRETHAQESTPVLQELEAPPVIDPPFAKPLQEAVEQGVFGATTDGPIDPDEAEVQAMTEEHGRELIAILADIQAVEDANRTGEDPRTGKIPRTPEAQAKLREFLEEEFPRLTAAYAAALDAYARGFGPGAAADLDAWARKFVADCTIEPKDQYDPGHPWHYLPEGDNSTPIPADQIEGDIEVGRFIEQELPKNAAKRAQKLRTILAQERDRLEDDKRRYQEIVERGAEALSRYDREIAHTNDAMARATALSLKYNHIRYGLGRIAWLERRLGLSSSSGAASELSNIARNDTDH